MNNIQLVENNNIRYKAQQAYSSMFNTNDKRDRKELLKTITKDSFVSYLFYVNCEPSEEEKAIVIDYFVDDLESCFQLFMKISQNDPIRQDIFATILTSSTYAFRILISNYVTNDERKIIYELYHKKYFDKFKNNPTGYFSNYFVHFRDFISDEEVEYLINLIVENEDIELARLLLREYDLPENLKDSLESLILMSNLNKDILQLIF